MDKAKTNANKKNSKYATRATELSEEEWLEVCESEYTPFTYPEFTKSKTKQAIILACVITVIAGLILLSIIISSLPIMEIVKEGFAAEVATPEQDAAMADVLIYFGIGALVLAAITVAVAFITRKIKLKKEEAKYNDEKQKAHDEWEKAKTKYLQSKKSQRDIELLLYEAMTCAFCGGEIVRDISEGTVSTHQFTDKTYKVQSTGYGTATLTPDYKTTEFTKRHGQSITCRCPKCKYKIIKREKSDLLGYTSTYEKSVSVDVNGSITKTDVEKTKTYEYVSSYNLDRVGI